MKTNVITELLRIEALPTTTDDQILEKANLINEFIEKQDGFIDAELIKGFEGGVWYLIYHIENVQKLKEVGEKLRSSKLFDQLTPLIFSGSMTVQFFNRYKTW